MGRTRLPDPGPAAGHGRLPQAAAVSIRPDQQRGSLKTKRDATDPVDRLPKPDWIRIKVPSPTGRLGETRDKARHPCIPTKSGLMVGLGETDAEVLDVLRALRAHSVDMLTIGQYLQPSGGHMLVLRYVHPDVFKMYADAAYQMGFKHAASGPLVRSSYRADEQARAAGVLQR